MNPVTAFDARPFGYGGGVRLHWIRPTDALFHHVKILRKPTNTFTGPNDAAATMVYTGKGVLATPHQAVFRPSPMIPDQRHRYTIDQAGIEWASTYYYAGYACDQAESDVSVAAVKSAQIPEVSAFEEVDVIGVLLEYVSAYFKRQVAIHGLQLPAAVTTIRVLDSPPLIDDVTFPCISIHLDADAPSGFAIGDDVHQLDQDGDTTVQRRGYLGTFTLAITAWTENPEIRRHLYRHLKGCLLSARQLLEQLGIVNTVVTGRYSEDFEGFNLPLFSAAFSMTGNMETAVRVVPVEPILATVTVDEPVLSGVMLMEGV